MNKQLKLSFALLGLFSVPLAAQAEATEPSAIHGFFDVKFRNDYLTPRGLLVTDTGLTTQVLAGLVFNVYDNPGAALSNVSFFVGTWSDFWSNQEDPSVGAFNEIDFFAGFNATLNERWKLGAQYVPFISPPGNFRTEHNLEFSVAYADGGGSLPFSINPYAKLFYNIDGDSTVVLGKAGGTYDVELGIAPTFNLTPGGSKITLSIPTWVTVGPDEYWGGDQNVGVFSTGIALKGGISAIPSKFGNWYWDAGVQYYNFLNDQLVDAATLLTGHTGRDEVVYSLGFGLGF